MQNFINSEGEPNKVFGIVKDTFLTIFAALLSALALHVFVYKNNFAPSGIDGIATMIQEVSGFNAGIVSVIINAPLLILAFFFLNKKYVAYTILFTVVSSAFVYVFAEINFYQFVAENDRLIVAVFSGAMLGIRTGIMLRIGASSGGIDVIASMVKQKIHGIDVEKIISGICYVIIGLSYFVYGDLTCILLSIVQMFVFEKAAAFVLKDSRNAVKFEIITKNPDALKDDIIYKLKHGATTVKSKGMFTDEESTIVVAIVNTRQVPEFLKLLKKYPDTFVYYTDVTGVNGNFRWRKDEEPR